MLKYDYSNNIRLLLLWPYHGKSSYFQMHLNWQKYTLHNLNAHPDPLSKFLTDILAQKLYWFNTMPNRLHSVRVLTYQLLIIATSMINWNCVIFFSHFLEWRCPIVLCYTKNPVVILLRFLLWNNQNDGQYPNCNIIKGLNTVRHSSKLI